MSKILLNPINSFPIEIPYKNLNKDLIYSLSNDNFDTLFYFKLILKINNKETVFINSGKKNFSNIIKYSKQIKYDQINNFEIQINYEK